MGRHENEKLDFNLPEPIKTSSFGYTEGAKACRIDDKNCYAKRLQKEQGSDVSSIYYLKFGRGKIFDPWGTYAGRQKTGDWDWKKVSYSVWSRYIRYLASRNTRHLTHAERMIIDDSQK